MINGKDLERSINLSVKEVPNHTHTYRYHNILRYKCVLQSSLFIRRIQKTWNGHARGDLKGAATL